MKNTSLCYITHKNKVLMLQRNKKQNDINEGKWIGIGGKFKENESPEECMLREVYEETGLVPTDWQYHGIVTFVSDECEGEYMHLFTAVSDSDKVINCDEGTLFWVEEDRVLDLNLWEGDRVFLKLLKAGEPFFSLKLTYKGEKLVSAVLNGKDIKA